jgi:SAM-dependent methyltransferase
VALKHGANATVTPQRPSSLLYLAVSYASVYSMEMINGTLPIAVAVALLYGRATATKASKASRSDRWRNIYSRKGIQADNTTPLHVLGGYDMFTLQQWLDQISILVGDKGPATTFNRNLAILPTEKVLEVGVGGGAFIDALQKIFGHFEMNGIDYCQSLIDRASARLVGNFAQGDARDLSPVPFATDASFDVVISFGVTQYLNSLIDVEKKFAEMVRVAKPGGRVVCCEVSDSAKEYIADAIRAKANAGRKQISNDVLTHLYIPKTFWSTDMCDKYDVSFVGLVDHSDLGLNYATAPYRYSVFFVKN